MRYVKLFFVMILLVVQSALSGQSINRTSFNENWKFFLGDVAAAINDINDNDWRILNVPHDWSIELPFDSTSPAGTGGGALRGGMGWYRKTFLLPQIAKGKNVFIDFDGVYMNSEVWINGHSLGIRPNGYISFRYDLTPYLKYGNEKNIITVKVDNSQQPNSRWYSGSGIYRNVWLATANDIFVDHWGTFITTPKVDRQSASIDVKIKVNNTSASDKGVVIKTILYDASNRPLATTSSPLTAKANGVTETSQQIKIVSPRLWSIEDPYLYKATTQVIKENKISDEYITNIGIRQFDFDVGKGFSLNGKPMKIIGVCNHHDLGCLGAAINTQALQRQLHMLKEMGINGIRTSHNPPAPELLDLCDKMGFIVMDEAFDMWKKPKNKFDYHLNWDLWHKKDLEDQVLRDRNHPSVFIWSIGNEIPEQWGNNGKDSSGKIIGRELADIVDSLDGTRPITAAFNNPWPGNEIYKSGALDLVGFNYSHKTFKDFPKNFPGQKFIATETVSSLTTRGHYDMPSDSIRRWPSRWDKPVENANPDLTCSAYDNCSAPWGSTHEETLKELLKYDFASGMFIWTGFDYLGEPTPYPWPARSSYFGIIDLAGFPKDVFYLYQSLFTKQTVLHVFPHWNWSRGQTIDIWAYYNNADEVELFINGKSQGKRKKQGDDLHVMWRVNYQPGTLKALSRKEGKIILTKEIKTAGAPAKLVLKSFNGTIKAGGGEMDFVSVSVLDKNENVVPTADNLIEFEIEGNGRIVAVDNGLQTDLSSFKANEKKAFNGRCLAVIQSNGKKGIITLKAKSDGLQFAKISMIAN